MHVAGRDGGASRRRWLLAGIPVAAGMVLAGTSSAGVAATGGSCPSWLTTPATTTTTTGTTTAAPAGSAPTIVLAGAPLVGARSAVLTASVTGAPVTVTVEVTPAGGAAACTPETAVTASQATLTLTGLQPATTYTFELAASGPAGTSVAAPATFGTLAAGTIAQGVTVGGVHVGRLGSTLARKELLNAFAPPLRLAYAGKYWRVPASWLGLASAVPHALKTALAATPGQQLPRPAASIDSTELRQYVASLAHRWNHPATQPVVKLVGKNAVITPATPGVGVDTARLTAELRSQLLSGKRSLVSLPVTRTRNAAAPPQKAVVVRLSSQTLTAYLNGKPVLKTPVTTGRPALPTPIGSFHVQFRASPYVFHSPWAPGSPYWYPPTPVTWAMEFYDGDFLHDDPGEPDDAFGSDSQNGYFASHGCVHVPHSAMAFLYTWLPVGAPVIVAER